MPSRNEIGIEVWCNGSTRDLYRMTLCDELGYLQLILCGILWFPQSGFESRHLNIVLV